MGTQQILMIILSVIVVGTAIAVGIQMFDTQLENQTRQALAAELMQQGAQAQAWFRTPVMMGGGGNGIDQTVNPAIARNASAIEIAQYIQRSAVAVGTNSATYQNLHGQFTLVVSGTPGAETVTITAASEVNAHLGAEAVITLSGTTGQIQVRQIDIP